MLRDQEINVIVKGNWKKKLNTTEIVELGMLPKFFLW